MKSTLPSVHSGTTASLPDSTAASLAAMTRLHEISTRFVQEGNTKSLFDQIVAAALEITGADMGNIQIIDEVSGRLQTVACRNLGITMPDCCQQGDKDLAACGIAMRRAERLVINDVMHSPVLAGTPWRQALLSAGIGSVQATPLFTRSGRIVGILSTHCRQTRQPAENDLRLLDMLARQIADIIEHAQAIEALRASTERYRSLFENMLDGYAHMRIILEDGNPADFEYLAANPAFERLTGLSNIAGKLGSKLIPGIHRDNPELLQIYGRVAATGEPARFETRLVALGVWVAVAAYRPASGEVAAVFDNITERKRLEGELQKRRDEMEILLKHQVAAQTAAAIAHDLNQPLVAISAYSEVALRALQQSDLPRDRLLHALECNVEQAQRAGRTLHELLDFMQRGDVVSAPMDLNDAVVETISLAAENGWGCFRPVLEMERNLPPVMGNRLQIQKVLDNLLLNAAEAIREAGTPESGITIAVRLLADVKQAQVTVRDSGPGLSSETAHRIFEPFFTTKERGIGLGLAISRTLIEAHGGRLWADPKAGPGATFHFTLPLTI